MNESKPQKEHLYHGKYEKSDVEAICKKALKKWGTTTQILMCIEELSELIKILAKSNRNINGSKKEEIAEEIADVKLMIKQMQIVFDINDITIASIEEEKLDRLNKYLKRDKNE